MENLVCVLEDDFIKGYLKRFPQQEWNEVIKKTLKLGIHSMNTLQSLSLINNSPEKNVSIIDMDGDLEDDSTVVLADSMNKLDGTTPSSKEGTKIIRNDSKLPLKKKKALSQVSKAKISRVTPKAKRCGFEFLREKKEPKRIHSVKGSKGKSESGKNHNLKETNQENTILEALRKAESEMNKESYAKKSAKSFKTLNQKVFKLHLSPKHQKNSPIIQKTSPKELQKSLGTADLNEMYLNSGSNRNHLVEFPLKVKKSLVLDPFVYITSSSEENSP